MKNFSPRLKKCVSLGDLTVKDLTYWFDRPYPTLWTWVYDGREPRGSNGFRRKLYERLDLLEHAIRKGLGFPVPDDMSDRSPERKKHIKGVRDGLEANGVSALRSA